MASAQPNLGTSILLVDDDEIFRARLVQALEGRAYRVFSAATYDDALMIGKQEQPEFAVFDLRLSKMTGLDLLSEFLSISPQTKVLILTGYGSIATALDAVSLGAVNYLTKPADADDILRAFTRDAVSTKASPLTFAASSAPSLAQAEWEHIQRILSDCKGNISQAAKVLGIPRRSLQRKLTKYPPLSRK